MLKFQALKPKLLDMVDDMLVSDTARMMAWCAGPGCEGPCLVWLQNRRLRHDYGEGRGEDTDDVEWVVDKQKPTCNEIYVLSPFSCQIMRASAK